MQARFLVAFAVLPALGCTKPPVTTPPNVPPVTPTVGESQGRVGGEQTPTAASGGEYDDPYGKNKDPINIVIDNQCSSTVMLFFGTQPRPGSNFYTTMAGQTQSDMMMMPGDRAWIVDEGQNGIAHTEIDGQSGKITIESSCDEIWAD